MSSNASGSECECLNGEVMPLLDFQDAVELNTKLAGEMPVHCPRCIEACLVLLLANQAESPDLTESAAYASIFKWEIIVFFSSIMVKVIFTFFVGMFAYGHLPPAEAFTSSHLSICLREPQSVLHSLLHVAGVFVVGMSRANELKSSVAAIGYMKVSAQKAKPGHTSLSDEASV